MSWCLRLPVHIDVWACRVYGLCMYVNVDPSLHSILEWLIISFPFTFKHLVLTKVFEIALGLLDTYGRYRSARGLSRCTMTINMMTGITSLFLVIQLLLNFIPSTLTFTKPDTAKCIWWACSGYPHLPFQSLPYRWDTVGIGSFKFNVL